MRRILAIVLIIVLLLGVLDFVAKAWIESKVESAADRELADAIAADASIDSFPILERLAFTGKVKRFTLDLAGIASQPLDVSLLHLELHDVRFDRGSLFSQPKLTGVGFVELSAVISEGTIRKATGQDIRLFGTGATIAVAGQTETARAEVVDTGIELSVEPATRVLIPLPDVDIVPCDVEFHFQKGGLVLTCTSNKVPKILVDAIGTAALREASS